MIVQDRCYEHQGPGPVRTAWLRSRAARGRAVVLSPAEVATLFAACWDAWKARLAGNAEGAAEGLVASQHPAAHPVAGLALLQGITGTSKNVAPWWPGGSRP